MRASTARAGPPRAEPAPLCGCRHDVHHAETLRCVPVIQLPGPPGRSRGSRAAQGRVLVLYLEEWELAPGREFQPVLAEALATARPAWCSSGRTAWDRGRSRSSRSPSTSGARRSLPRHPGAAPGTERPRRGDVAHLEFLINASWVEFLTTLDERAFRAWSGGSRGSSPWSRTRRGTRGAPLSRPGGVPTRRRGVLLRPRQPDGLAGRRPAARSGRARGAFPGRARASGSGKSSVGWPGWCRAEGGGDRRERCWPVAILRPGDDPLKNLAAGVVPRFRPLPDAAHV